jgi:regulator of sigma E protease
MNILLAVVLITGVYMVHYAHAAFFDEPAVVGYVVPDSPAAKAGVEPGDRIVRLGNEQDPHWEGVLIQVTLSPGQPLNLAVRRGNEILHTTITPVAEGQEEAGDAGWFASRPVEVGSVEANGPADKAGIHPGDTVGAVNGKPLACVEALIDFLDQNQTKPLALAIVRDGRSLNLSVTPIATDLGGQTHYRLHFSPADPVRISHLSFPKAFTRSVETNRRYSQLILQLVQKLVERKASIKQFAGPIGIGAAAGQAARQPGWTPLLELTALISLNLGIINLLPIPILDGGLILLLFVEALIRRDISRPIKERIYQAAFVFLLLIGVIVIYNDLSRYVPGLSNHLP